MIDLEDDSTVPTLAELECVLQQLISHLTLALTVRILYVEHHLKNLTFAVEGFSKT